MKNQKLSVLIPAFNYLDGIKKILLESDALNHDSIEVLIYDNSTNDNIQNFIKKLRLKLNAIKSKLIYKRRKNSNYIDNWNNLINDSVGKYFILIHHDEFFVKKNFFESFLNSDYNDYDLIINRCRLYKKNKSYLHFPLPLIKILLSIPKFILLKNYLGPTATLFIKSTYKQNFNRNLQWLVDVDYYYRLTIRTEKIKFSKDIIGSNLDYDKSITKKINPLINSLNKKERNIIFKDYKLNKINYFMLILIFVAVKKIFNIFSTNDNN